MSSDELGEAAQATAGKLFHVVCRDCTMEELTETRTKARRLRAVHRKRTDHTVAHERIQ